VSWNDKQHRSFNEGVFNSPGSDRPRDAVEQVAYEQGQRLRGGRSVGSGSSQTLAEAVGTAVALAGAAGGFVFGLLLVGRGQAGWLAVGGLTIGGLAAGALLSGLVGGAFRRGRTAGAWSGGPPRDAESFERMWEARFGEAPRAELLEEVDDGGRGWTVDRNGNFLIRTRGGKQLFVGRRGDGARDVVETSGRGEFTEAVAFALVAVHQSLGKEKLRVGEGSKSARRLIWAAARLRGMEVEGYVPDAKALELYDRISRDSRFLTTTAEN